MRVLVTGGTGFVGAHSAKALTEAGHEVRLLVRDPGRIEPVLGPLGVTGCSHVVGDMTDPVTVAEAVAGCDAALHCAAVVALDKRSGPQTVAANAAGAEHVLGTAAETGLDPIVHVSSAVALWRPGVPRITPDLPPTVATSAYMRSKALAERTARRLQADGAPVAIVYPGAVAGPPAGSVPGEVAQTVVTQCRWGFLPTRDGWWSIVDVRDLAAVHAALMVAGQGPRRVMCGGHYLGWDLTAEIYRDLTGRRFPVVPTPGWAMRLMGRINDAVMRRLPVSSQMTAEAMDILTRWVPTDDRAVEDELGIRVRPPEDTLRESILGVWRAGRLADRHVGRLGVRAPYTASPG